MSADWDALYRIDSFIGPHCRGNQHRVVLNPALSGKSAPFNNEHLITVLLTADQEPRVRFQQRGRPIVRCGSGTLAAAHVLYRELNHSGSLRLQSAAGPLLLRESGEWLGYSSHALPRIPSARKSQWEALLDQSLRSCWAIGGDEDYCMVELEDPSSLRDLRVDSEALCDFSRRALIATSTSDDPAFDYLLRYFAPQHGNEEDAATGSANVQLAPFWRERLGKTTLLARQVSKAGGEFMLDIMEENVWVMGRTRMIPLPRCEFDAGGA